MATQDLRDKSGRLLGRIKENSAGQLEIRSPSGRLLGRYDPRTNQTRSPSGRLVGKGNLLTTLLT